jgi:lipooligosaccharide transport system permease protein
MSTQASAYSQVHNAAQRRIRRLEPAALAGVMSRDIAIFGRYWKATTFSSIMQPTIYLLAFGLGLGSLLPHIAGLKYEQYVATGVVATAVLFSSAFPGMFNTFIRWQFQRTYDAVLAAPVDVEELITAEILWIAIRAGVYGMAPLLVGFAFGLEPNAGMLLVPLIGFVTGFGFAGFGVTVAAVAKTIDNFNYITSAVLTPMFLRRHILPDHPTAERAARDRQDQSALPLCAAGARRLAGDAAGRRYRPRGGADRLRAADVATGDLAAWDAIDRLRALRGYLSQRATPPWCEQVPLRDSLKL